MAWCIAAGALGLAGAAQATPQVNAGVAPGVDWRPNSKLAFDGAISADVLFARSSDTTWGWGPRLELGTRAFDDLRLGAGLSALAPFDPCVLTATAHGLVQAAGSGVNPGVGGRFFFGLRPYNYYGWYSAGAGLSLGIDHVFGAGETTVLLAAQVDAMWLTLPVLFAVELLRH